MASVGLVLGGGGIAGAAWHGAALAALEEHGWDARSAELIVGTSAGASVAAALRAGVPAADLLAGTLGEPMSDIGRDHAARSGSLRLPPMGGGMRLALPTAPRLLLRSLLPPWRARPLLAMAALQRTGEVPTAVLGDRVRRTHDRDWPDQPTWITAVRLRDGVRVVFGRDITDADLGTAVEASSAIPGYFAPVRHRGVTYVDGGAHSPTNADLVAGAGFDIVVVSSPMSGTREALRPLRLTSGRALHTATLAREVRAVRAAGTLVLVLHPGAQVVSAIGNRSMDPSLRRDIARTAHETVRAHLASGRVDDRVALLRS